MSDQFLGEIQMFGFDFAPAQWALCAGQLLPISQNTALFSLLGTTYGGDGRSNFALPNLQGFTACGQGQGPALSDRTLGEVFGTTSVTLLESEMPRHSHAVNVYAQRDATKLHGTPLQGDAVTIPTATAPFADATPANAGFAPSMVGVAGGSQPHENRQPYLTVNFCIALRGIFPPRP
ncbi:microcystin-dependent protein [Stenotrophomonas sp. 2619]|uniref:phage tail protein n=1 Tax=Stenotrophomonas sp. 2619 TaxID=3156316 RepID=UPI00339B7E8B